MRLLKFFEATRLDEAARDRYMQMFTPIGPYVQKLNQPLEQAIISAVDWAVPTLRKDDKIVWYLRWIKLEVLRTINKNIEDASPIVDGKVQYPFDEQTVEKIAEMYKKALSQMAAKSRISVEELPRHSQQIATSDFRRSMEHYMSLGIQAITDYQFNWKTPQEIWADWQPIEQLWQERQSKFMDIDYEDGHVESLIKYPDNSEWVNINRQYCDREAKAMGHCANSASYKADDTLLSYRTVEKDANGNEGWVPHLTFVLDTATGLLGETKGRENQKPDGKYHGVIMDLLKLPLIKGIRGGGYKPENNFKIEDLPDDVAEKIIEEKPGLATMAYDYKKRGMTRELLARIESMWEETETPFPIYNKNRKAFMAGSWKDVDDFVSEVQGADTARYLVDIFSGNSHDLFDMQHGGNTKDLWESMPANVVVYVGKWLLRNYDSSVEEWKEHNDQNFDPTNHDDVWDVMSDDGIEEVTDILSRAMDDGMVRGTEAEMHNSFTDWLDDLPNPHQFNLSIYPGTGAYDSEQKIEIPEDLMIELVSDHIDEIEQQGDLVDWFEIGDVNQPYNGWSDYDEEYAIEQASSAISSEL